ncbi:hypothetical protein TURU_165992 [Turdus rufiventris]|nr:hypothetical protein TURU_165992 [Turdus rufiventris]
MGRRLSGGSRCASAGVWELPGAPPSRGVLNRSAQNPTYSEKQAAAKGHVYDSPPILEKPHLPDLHCPEAMITKGNMVHIKLLTSISQTCGSNRILKPSGWWVAPQKKDEKRAAALEV